MVGLWRWQMELEDEKSPGMVEAVYSSPEVFKPVRMVIPRIEVDTLVEDVGLDSDGRMAAPVEEKYVGWYSLGVLPGEMGSAVMAGHFDDEVGPAVFFRLGELELGDVVQVVDAQGKALEFEVLKKERYEDDMFPLRRVFEDNSGKYLNLITCDGWFSETEEDYSERLVVYTRLKV